MNDDHAMRINRLPDQRLFEPGIYFAGQGPVPGLGKGLKAIPLFDWHAHQYGDMRVALFDCGCPLPGPTNLREVKHLDRQIGTHGRASAANDCMSRLRTSLLRLLQFLTATLSRSAISFFGRRTTTGATAAGGFFFCVFTLRLWCYLCGNTPIICGNTEKVNTFL